VAVAFSIAWEQAGVEAGGRDEAEEDARARERLAGLGRPALSGQRN
jgi:hypothetical protein